MAFGLLNIDKPTGMTSHDVVNIVRKKTKVSKVGHAGTLDPAASGVLVLCIGQATRLSEYVMNHLKLYEAEITLGATSTTYDAEGEISEGDGREIGRDEFESVLPPFKGAIQQVPPMYSAIKQGGEKLYEKARRGEDVEREPRDVTIYRLSVEDFSYPTARITVRCTPGTYIRSLAHDIGAVLGVGGYLSGLRRIASGENFTVANAITLDDLDAAIAAGTWEEHLFSARAGLSQFPYIELNNQQEAVVRNGGRIPLDISNAGPIQAWTDEGLFVAIMSRVDPDEDNWKPDKVFTVGLDEE